MYLCGSCCKKKKMSKDERLKMFRLVSININFNNDLVCSGCNGYFYIAPNGVLTTFEGGFNIGTS